jgi:hypothetical protein
MENGPDGLVTSRGRGLVTQGIGILLAWIVLVSLPLAVLGRSLFAFVAASGVWLLAARLLSSGSKAVLRDLRSQSLTRVQRLLVSIGLGSALLATISWFYTQGGPKPLIPLITLLVYLAGCASLLVWISSLGIRNQLAAGIALGVTVLVGLWLDQNYYLQLTALIHRHPLNEYDPRYLHNWNLFVFDPYVYLLIQTLGLFSLFSCVQAVWDFVASRLRRPSEQA